MAPSRDILQFIPTKRRISSDEALVAMSPRPVRDLVRDVPESTALVDPAPSAGGAAHPGDPAKVVGGRGRPRGQGAGRIGALRRARAAAGRPHRSTCGLIDEGSASTA